MFRGGNHGEGQWGRTGSADGPDLPHNLLFGMVPVWPVGEEDTEQARHARSNRTLAAPGELRALIETTAHREGVTVEHIDAISRIHYRCGTEFDPGELADRINVWCPTCQQSVDQDINTCEHLLGAANQAA